MNDSLFNTLVNVTFKISLPTEALLLNEGITLYKTFVDRNEHSS